MAETLFGSILGGMPVGFAYKDLMGQFKDQQKALPGQLENIRGDMTGAGSFQPWSVRSGLGSTSFDPATGQMTNQLSGQQQGYSDFQGQGAQDMFSRSMMDPTQREGEIYERIRAMQRPGEERGYDSMNANLFGSGRGGMSSAGFGGSPEQFAFGKAQAEARNTASFGAMNQAQTEMQNYAGIGQQMFQNQYQPYNQMMQFGNQGLQNQQMRSQSGMNMAGLLAQLGIGGMTTDVNFANVQGEAMVGLMEALGMAGGGIGDALTGLFDWATTSTQ